MKTHRTARNGITVTESSVLRSLLWRSWGAIGEDSEAGSYPRIFPKAAAGLVLALGIVLIGWTAASAQPVITLSPPIQLTTDPATQLDPAISGDIVVFTDLRNGNEDVYYYDLSSGTETRITTLPANQRLNDVSGSRIVYTDYTPPGARITLYDVTSGLTDPITSGPDPDQNPRIDGDIVVFERGPSTNLDVIAIDLSSGLETPVAGTNVQEQAPVVSGRRVACERHASPGAPGEIVVFDLDTLTETVLGDPALDDRRPDIDGDLLVWDVLTASGDLDIAIHDLSTGTTQVLAMAGNQRAAHVSGRVVVFDDDSSGTSDVLLYHIDSGQTIPVAAESGPLESGTEFLNDISRGRIVYTSNAAGNFDIWLVEFEVLSFDPPGGLEFGSLNVGSSNMQIVTLTYLGGDLEVTDLSLDSSGSPGFSIGLSAPQTVARGDSLDIPVTFAPTAAGAAINTLIIITDAGTVEVPLSGTGVEPPQQEAVLCGTLQGGALPDVDAYELRGSRGETVTVTLAADPLGTHTDGRAALALFGIGLLKGDASTLPNTITATLPRTGTFYVTVSELLLGTGKFSGDYCVSLESSGNAWQTFRRR